MQGIIFGVLAGVVAVICFIIVGICYYRHRNRLVLKYDIILISNKTQYHTLYQ
jgi:type IV secretory pathway VirB2 component (pilin)